MCEIIYVKTMLPLTPDPQALKPSHGRMMFLPVVWKRLRKESVLVKF